MKACAANTWDHDSDASTACIAHSECGADEHVSAEGTATTDAQCEPIQYVALSAGVVRCWGEDSDGQSSVPEDLSASQAVSAGAEHTCALSTTGEITCWGSDYYDQLAVPELLPLP